MLRVLFSAGRDQWPIYEAPLRAAFDRAGLHVDLGTKFAPEDVDYIVFAPNGPVTDFTPYTKCKALLSLWAGVETTVDNPTLTQPLLRMVDKAGLTQGMVEWVTGHVLRHHLGMDAHILQQDGVWREAFPPVSADRPVTILGLGALGTACGQALGALGFPVTGWSRSAKSVDGITCVHGDAGLREALRAAQIVVLLLPDTPATTNTLNADTLALLAQGAFVLNPGRGPLIDDAALIAALDSGQVAHATLDVFRVEPLPKDHAYWAHPKVTVTPHIASTTRPSTAAEVIAAQITRGEAGQPFLHVVDRKAGY